MNLTNYVKAGFPYLFIQTQEIKRAIKVIELDDPYKKYIWNMDEGFIESPNGSNEETNQLEALEIIRSWSQCITIFENFDLFLTPPVIQKLLNHYEQYKYNQNVVIFLGSTKQIPPQIEKLVTIVPFDLPTKEEFRVIAKDLCEQINIEYKEDVADICAGLSLEEGENALALSAVKYGEMNRDVIIDLKRESIKSTGFLDFLEAESIENLGGLRNLKEYVFKRRDCWDDPTKPRMRNIFLCGIPGTGKSQAAKAIASMFNWPLLIMDIGAMKGSLVGETEKNLRKATKIIDANPKMVILLDEIEKSLAGSTGQNLDSGVSSGILQHMLTWMQESKGEKIIIATANDITALPTEMLRAGRWDCLWFVDFPNEEERKDIIEIMNRKWGSDIPIEYAKNLEGFTGAEIEQLAKDSHFDSIEDCIPNIPLVKNVKKMQIEKIKELAKGIRIANGEERKQIKSGRTIGDQSLVDDDLKFKLKKRLNLKK